MSSQQHMGFKAFLLAFLVSTAALGLISTGVIAITGLFSRPDFSEQSVAGELQYQPVSEDNITILLMCCEDDTKSPYSYTLLRFYPEGRVIRLVPLPKELEATVNIKTGTLLELYEYGGVQMVCDGVENVFFIEVDRYLKCNEAALSDFIDQIGGIEYEVERTVEFQKQGSEEKSRLVKGVQLLGGKKVIDYFYSPLVTELSGEKQLEKRAEFLKIGLEQRFSEGILSRTDELFGFLTNSMQTNLTNYDYTIRKEAIRLMGRIETQKVVCLEVEGNYYTEKKGKVTFQPTEAGKSTVQAWFEPMEES